MPNTTQRALDSAVVAVEHAAKLLGRVTHAANHHEVQQVDEDGNVRWLTKRDSQAAPRVQRTTATGPQTKPPKTCLGTTIPAVKPWSEPAKWSTAANRKRSQAESERQTREDLLRRRVSEIGDKLTVNSERQPAADRLLALASRVRQRLAESSQPP